MLTFPVRTMHSTGAVKHGTDSSSNRQRGAASMGNGRQRIAVSLTPLIKGESLAQRGKKYNWDWILFNKNASQKKKECERSLQRLGSRFPRFSAFGASQQGEESVGCSWGGNGRKISCLVIVTITLNITLLSSTKKTLANLMILLMDKILHHQS